MTYADLGCRSGTSWQLASREESLALAITMRAAPSWTEVVNLLFGQLPRSELHFYAMNGALRGPGHNRPIINLLSYRNVAGEQVATQTGVPIQSKGWLEVDPRLGPNNCKKQSDKSDSTKRNRAISPRKQTMALLSLEVPLSTSEPPD
jgi:hypothetical protein